MRKKHAQTAMSAFLSARPRLQNPSANAPIQPEIHGKISIRNTLSNGEPDTGRAKPISGARRRNILLPSQHRTFATIAHIYVTSTGYVGAREHSARLEAWRSQCRRFPPRRPRETPEETRCGRKGGRGGRREDWMFCEPVGNCAVLSARWAIRRIYCRSPVYRTGLRMRGSNHHTSW